MARAAEFSRRAQEVKDKRTQEGSHTKRRKDSQRSAAVCRFAAPPTERTKGDDGVRSRRECRNDVDAEKHPIEYPNRVGIVGTAVNPAPGGSAVESQ